MRFDCGKRTSAELYEARHRAQRLWHKWFAWYPVRVGRNDCRWLETVQRKGNWGVIDWDYEMGETFGWVWEYRKNG